MTDGAVNRVVSLVSIWEIAIKHRIDKPRLPVSNGELVKDLAAEQVELLAMSVDDILEVETLPWHHRDPFDRLIISQALRRDPEVLSNDRKFDAYGVRRVW